MQRIQDEDTTSRPYRWKRVLLKVNGESFAAGDQIIDPQVTMTIAEEVASVVQRGIEVAIVVGGRNIIRGSSWVGCNGLAHSSADYMGMLATVMNAIFLQATMESIGIPTRVHTPAAFHMCGVAEPYIRGKAMKHLAKGEVLIFAAGTGNPSFTTDTAAALHFKEINADVLLKAINVDDFAYEEDPILSPNSCRLDTLSYEDFTKPANFFSSMIEDMTAITLCKENRIPVVVFNILNTGDLLKLIMGEKVGTMIGGTWNQNPEATA
ncbi:uridylate kinase PUMPKIN, chloroplastic-like isoform X2 [Tasmannia lanceolata]|uniref:uridylate kinase PUMPKIN, chloroplastic-like isoform X2 n=1 Tax=Tasmannia lanceolata TaxID=3420 RepID=UPI00406286A8